MSAHAQMELSLSSTNLEHIETHLSANMIHEISNLTKQIKYGHVSFANTHVNCAKFANHNLQVCKTKFALAHVNISNVHNQLCAHLRTFIPLAQETQHMGGGWAEPRSESQHCANAEKRDVGPSG